MFHCVWQLHFDVAIDNRVGRPRGVYLRQPDETVVKQTLSVNVKPEFRKYDVDDETQKKKIDLELRFRLEATASWVTAPDVFVLMHNGRSFKMEVDPTGLPPGVHTAKVLAFDSSRPSAGPMFAVPITVVKTLPQAQDISLGELEFEQNEIKRFFLDVPKGATWMDVTIQDDRADKTDSAPRLVVLHTIQLLPHAAYRDNEVHKNFNLYPSATKVTSIRVEEGVTMEMVLARYWSTQGSTRAKVSVRFRGIRPCPDQVQILTGGGGGMVRIYSDLEDETVMPTAKLTAYKTPLRPKTEGVITPLPDDRDVLPYQNKRIYQLVLSYEFNQEEAGSFTPRAPALQGLLYESAYESQMMLIFDSQKKYLGVADAYPSDVKAPKGNVTIRMQIRHDSPEMLEKLTNMTIWIERKLDSPITLKAFSSREAMQVGKSTMKKRILRKGLSASVFFEEPGKIPSACKPGDVLTGTANYGSGEASLPGEGKRPGGYAVSCLVGPKAPTKPSTEATTPEVPDERTVDEKITEAIRDLKVGQLGKLTSKEKESGKFEELFESLKTEYPGHLPLLVEMLKKLDGDDKRKELLSKIVEAADDIVAAISKDDLASHYGKNLDKEDPKKVKERKDMDEKKGALVDALARKARAQADADDYEGFDATLQELKEWVDINGNQKYAVLVLAREERAKRHGLVLKLLNELLEKDGEGTKGGICPFTKKQLLERRAEVLKKLGFLELVERDTKRRLIDSPDSFALF